MRSGPQDPSQDPSGSGDPERAIDWEPLGDDPIGSSYQDLLSAQDAMDVEQGPDDAEDMVHALRDFMFNP